MFLSKIFRFKNSGILKLTIALFLLFLFVIPMFLVGVGIPLTRQVSAQSSMTALSIGTIGTAPLPALNPFDPASDFTLVGIEYDYMFSLNWPPLPYVTPVMAGNYSSNPNGTQWTISVRPNLKWDNGSPLNATDLWYTLNMFNATGFFPIGITSMAIVSPTAVRMNLSSAQPNLPLTGFVNSGFAVLPYQTFKNLPINIGNLSSFQNLNNIVADGPFVFTNYSGSENPIVMKANQNYWNGPPHLETLNYYYYSSLTAEFAAYSTGLIDAVGYPGAYTGLSSISNLTGHSIILPPYATPGLTVEALLNNWMYPTNLTLFRRGLAFGTDVSTINQELNGAYANKTSTNQDYLLSTYNQAIGYSNGTGPTGYSYNVTRAKAILGSIPGFMYSGSTLQYSNGTQVSLTIKFRYPVEPYSQNVATLLADEWSQLGIAVNPVAVPSPTLRAGANNATGWQVIATGVLGPQTDNGVTPGPGILQDIGDYWVFMGSPPNQVHTSWNSTFYSIIQRMATEPQNSSAFKADARNVTLMYVQGVPTIPLFIVYNWAAVSNSFYWGSPTNSTGVYYTQAITQLVYWDLSLDTVAPAASTTSTSTSASSSSSATGPSSSATTSSTAATSVSSSSASSISSATSSTVIVSSSSPPASSTSTSTSNNTALYVGAAVVIIIIIAAAAAFLMRRGRGAPAATSTP